ncbi:MAG TPA: peptidoglycan DD-metalloendopeptidase family protein [Bryobacteraceae bacterium]|nr:peptidoglycan DD-metalloendopeptidase family protein [Bryobacteraceae bacterium]
MATFQAPRDGPGQAVSTDGSLGMLGEMILSASESDRRNRHAWPNARTIKRLLVAVVLALLPLRGPAESHSGFPVDIIAGPAPQPVMVDGRIRLVYELHLINVAPIPIELLTLDVFSDNGASALASYRGEALEKLLVPVEKVLVSVEPTEGAGKTRAIAEGHSVVIFLDLTLEAGARPPRELRHRLTFSIRGNAALDRTVNAPIVAVVQEPAPVLSAPLRGSAWIAFNAFSAYDHRRAFQTVDGRLCIAQRFAIDWMRIGPDGRLFHGDSKSNANFYGYGAEVLAVADARVSDLRDDLPDNTGSNERSNRHVTVDNAVGNYLILDLGRGHFAVYAHLQPGSSRVKLGDKVKAGQVLALLGNSGNSDEPHLHFQLTDANAAMAAEGVPYELATFTQLGVVDDPGVLDSDEGWRPKTQTTPVVHRREFPIDNAVVTFP